MDFVRWFERGEELKIEDRERSPWRSTDLRVASSNASSIHHYRAEDQRPRRLSSRTGAIPFGETTTERRWISNQREVIVLRREEKKQTSLQTDDLVEPTNGLNRVGTRCPENNWHAFVVFVRIDTQCELCQGEYSLQGIVIRREMTYLVDVLGEIGQGFANVFGKVLDSRRDRPVKQCNFITLKLTVSLRQNRRVAENSALHVPPSSSWWLSKDTDWRRSAVRGCPVHIETQCFHSTLSAVRPAIPWRTFEPISDHESDCVTRAARVWRHCSMFDTTGRETRSVRCRSSPCFACVTSDVDLVKQWNCNT